MRRAMDLAPNPSRRVKKAAEETQTVARNNYGEA